MPSAAETKTSSSKEHFVFIFIQLYRIRETVYVPSFITNILDNALIEHCIGDFDEAGDISTYYKITGLAVLLSSFP
jgi:hypothetical protein